MEIFKKHLSKIKKEKAIWTEKPRQPDEKGWKIRNHMIQDAEFSLQIGNLRQLLHLMETMQNQERERRCLDKKG